MLNHKLATPVQYLKGVGPKLAKVLGKIGIFSVEDLLFFLPRTYEDRRLVKPLREQVPADLAVIKGEIEAVDDQPTRSRFSVLKVTLIDSTGSIQAVFFNQPFLKRLFRPGMRLIISGKVEFSAFDGVMQVAVRDYEIDTGNNPRIVPIYPLTQGLYPKKMRSLIQTALDHYVQYFNKETEQALRILHLPSDLAEIEKARNRLAFDELFIFELGLLLERKKIKEETKGIAFKIDNNEIQSIKKALPFALTEAQ
jgi:ATP-dependent DNA helicase RecG